MIYSPIIIRNGSSKDDYEDTLLNSIYFLKKIMELFADDFEK